MDTVRKTKLLVVGIVAGGLLNATSMAAAQLAPTSKPTTCTLPTYALTKQAVQVLHLSPSQICLRFYNG